MKDRLAQLLAGKGVSASKFAEIIDVQPSNISHILSGRSNPGYDMLVKILQKFPDISPDWLLMGAGEMYRGAHRLSAAAPHTSHTPDEPHGNFLNNSNAAAENRPLDSDIPLIELAGANIELSKPTKPNAPEAPTAKQVIILYSDNSASVFKIKDK